MMSKSITFLMPGYGGIHPIGGYKVVYEYANRFVSDGYDVHIMLPMSMYFREASVIDKSKAILRYLYNLVTGHYKPYNWFDLDRRVRLHPVLSLLECFAPKSDIYIATAIKTSEYLDAYKGVESNKKFYFIQGYENWGNVSDERLFKTYRFKMQKICISKWLSLKIEETGSNSIYIPNGFDFNKFKLINPIKSKDKFQVCTMYHKSSNKGCEFSFKALDIVKEKYPKLKVVLFGATRPIEQFPDWYEFHYMPSAELHNEIYNKSAIYIASSLSEGWGLTVGEAMICGAAIACTDIDGFKEMVVDGESALLSPTKDPVAMAENIIKLIEDDELRYTLAHNGNETIKQFTWERSYNKFKKTILG